MDGDIFGRVTRLGRAAAEAVMLALGGARLNGFLPSRCLDALIGAGAGVPSLGVIIAELEGLSGAPLLARLTAEDAMGRIQDATRGQECTELDLVLGSVTKRSIIRGEFETPRIVERFFRELLDRAILTGRGGVLEQDGPARLDEARALLAPIAGAAAAILCARPDAKRLGLARSYPEIRPDTDLLEGM